MGKLAVVIGRFQPFHNGHLHILTEASKWADKILVIIGSVNQPRTPKNPFTYQERRNIIQNSFKEKEILFQGIEDCQYNNREWFVNVATIIKKNINTETEICIFGFNKDKSSEYFEAKQIGFPCKSVTPHKIDGIVSATNIRNAYFENKIINACLVNKETATFLQEFKNTYDFARLQEEHLYYKDYVNNKFPRTYVTADAVIIKDNKILLITRKSTPGKGLLALPGGFLNQQEWVADCCVREVCEETKINIHKNVLKTFIKETKYFDEPSRSERGRVITFASIIDLTPYPKEISIFPNDDAGGIGWYDIDEVILKRDVFFEDHLDIIKVMLKIT